MTDELKIRITKICKIVKDGATAGEQQAANEALKRLFSKYNLSLVDLEGINKTWHSFTYTSAMEEELLKLIIEKLTENYESIIEEAYKTSFDEVRLRKCRQIRLNLEHLDYVTIDSAYEYFRRHMKAQWIKTGAIAVGRCRKQKTKNKKRKELQGLFMARYFFESGLLTADEIVSTPVTSQKALEQNRALAAIEGGQYNTQLQNGLMLESGQSSVQADKHGQISLFS